MNSPFSNSLLNKLRRVNDYQGGYTPPTDVADRSLDFGNGLNGTRANLGDVTVKGARPIRNLGTVTPNPISTRFGTMSVPNGMRPLSMNNTKAPGKSMDWKGIAGRIASTGQALAPYASNIANAFRKPPMPIMPQMNNYQALSKVNMDDDRYRVNRETDASSAMTDRTLDANTAARVRSANLGTKLNSLSQISEQERNANVGIGNQQAQMDMQTDYINKERMNGYNDSLVERNIAQQNQQSTNLSNAADKYINIQNEQEKRTVDLQKTKMLGLAYSSSGVDNSLRMKAKAQGLPDPYGMDYKNIDNPRKDVFGTSVSKKYGGRLPTRKLY